jgi:hypothetical protein
MEGTVSDNDFYSINTGCAALLHKPSCNEPKQNHYNCVQTPNKLEGFSSRDMIHGKICVPGEVVGLNCGQQLKEKAHLRDEAVDG